MEECDAGPALTARVDSGATRVLPAQVPAEVGAGLRSQPHAGPQIAAQQQRHTLTTVPAPMAQTEVTSSLIWKSGPL